MYAQAGSWRYFCIPCIEALGDGASDLPYDYDGDEAARRHVGRHHPKVKER